MDEVERLPAAVSVLTRLSWPPPVFADAKFRPFSTQTDDPEERPVPRQTEMRS